MPLLDLMAERANTRFGRTTVANVSAQDLQATTLSQVAEALGIAETSAEREFLNSWPAALQQALLAAVRSAVTRTNRVPVTMAWQPGYDYGLHISESHAVGTSVGRVTIILTSPYPTP